MGVIKPKWVAISLAQEFESETFTPLSRAIILHLQAKVETLSPEAAADFAEENLQAVLRHLHEHREELSEDGIEPDFDIEGDATSAYIKSSSSLARKYRVQMTELSPSEFEDLCWRILVAIGAEEGARVGKSGDQGVDFIARNWNLVKPAPIGARIMVIGQAKKYAIHNTVGDSELREFVGGAIKRLGDATDSLVHRPERLAPVIYAFWTTGEFAASALNYAKSVGLWHLNGLGLAQLALRHSVPLRPVAV